MNKEQGQIQSGKLGARGYLGILIVFILGTGLAVFFGVPLLRQVMGVLFLTFIPGWLILALLKLNKLEATEKIVLTVGLSVAFLMFFGLVFNQICLLFGYMTPLSPTSLAISLSLVLVSLAFTAYLRNKEAFIFTPFALKLSVRDKLLLLIPSFFPLLSILGTRLMNISDNNLVLLVILLLIPSYIMLVSFLHHQVSPHTYPLLILMISTSLVLMWGLRSGHIMGWDAHREYYFFQLTSQSQHWQIFERGDNLSSCLSVTLLPAVYQSFLNVNPEYFF